MKQLFIAVMLIAGAYTARSQAYAGITGTTHTLGLDAGYVFDNGIQGSVSAAMPINNKHLSSRVDVSGGYRLNLTNQEYNFNITTSVGVAIIEYDTTVKAGVFREDYGQAFSYDSEDHVRKFVPIYKVELGRDVFQGRLFVGALYTDKVYVTAGLRFFFNQ